MAISGTTVVIPTFNSAESLSGTLKSIFTQEVPPDEILVIDGGSKDQTLEVAGRYLRSSDRVFSEPDRGPYDAMNKGIRLANSEIVAILNSDDRWEEGTLGRVSAVFSEYPTVGIVHGNVRYVMLDGSEFTVTPTEGIWRWLGLGLPTSHPATFVRKSVYEKVGAYDFGRFPICADQDFVYRALEQGVKDLHLDVILTRMYTGGMSSTHNLSDELDRLMNQRGRMRRLACNSVRVLLDRDDAYFNGLITEGFGERLKEEVTSVARLRMHRREIVNEFARIFR